MKFKRTELFLLLSFKNSIREKWKKKIDKDVYSLCPRFFACSIFDLQDPTQTCLTFFPHKMPSMQLLWVFRKISLKIWFILLLYSGSFRFKEFYIAAIHVHIILLLFVRCFNILWYLLINYCGMSKDNCCRFMLKHNHHL